MFVSGNGSQPGDGKIGPCKGNFIILAVTQPHNWVIWTIVFWWEFYCLIYTQYIYASATSRTDKAKLLIGCTAVCVCAC